MYKIKYTIFLLIVIITVIYLFKSYYTKEGVKPSINFQQTSENKFEGRKIIKSKKVPNSQTYVVPVLSENASNAIPEFNSDPVIQNSIVSAKYHVCGQYFYEKMFLVKDYQKKFDTEIQQKYYKNSTKNCEKLNSQYPEYGFSLSREQILEKIKTKATSKFGKLLEYNKDPYTHEETLFVYKTIGRDYPDLINSSSVYKTMQYEIDVANPDLQNILQTTSINYVSKIINLTQNYLACDLGANCGSDSRMMHSYCHSEPNFCVKDFMTLFKVRLTAGVRSDVLLALPYIEKLFQVD